MKSWLGDSSDGLPIRAGIYLRISTLDQKEGHGIQMQKTKCEAMATVKGWSISKVYKDEGISGTVNETERPAFSQLLKDAKNKEIDAVIVYALDRLGRRTQIVLRTIENLDNQGVKVVSCRENLDTSTPTGTFMVTIFAALSQLERDTIVERMKAGTEERRKIDGDIGGHVPMGYVRKMSTVMINEEKAEIVRYIFQRRYIDFRYMYEIADELNEKGAPKPTKRGKVWKSSVVQRILDNEAKYKGGYRNKSKFRWPRILPEDFDEEEARVNQAKKQDKLLDLPDPTGNPKFTKTQLTGGDRKIARSRRAIEQLKSLEKGEIIPSPSTIELPKKPKYFDDKREIKIIADTEASSIEKIPSPILNIPSPENIRRNDSSTTSYYKQNSNNIPSPKKASTIPKVSIPSPKKATTIPEVSIPSPALHIPSPETKRLFLIPEIPSISEVSRRNISYSPPRPPPTMRMRLQPKNNFKKSVFSTKTEK